MEKKYGTTGVIAQTMLKNGVLKGQDSIKFFRGFKSVQDIRDMSSESFEKFVDLHHLHISDGCSDSCEPFHEKAHRNLNNHLRCVNDEGQQTFQNFLSSYP